MIGLTDPELLTIARKVLHKIDLLQQEYSIFTMVSSVCMQAGTPLMATALLPFIGSQIRHFRKKKKMDQLDLADAVHLSASQVSRHENGQQLTVEILENYAYALDCSIHDLLPPDQLRIIDDALRAQVAEIMNLIPEAADLPAAERDKVLSIVENALKLALRK